ncbi:MAG: hypothetical protein KA152_15685 [Verrucomicrobiales bacterium]|nr:hypothetical protein [Verrucomicrobiales bacterium]
MKAIFLPVLAALLFLSLDASCEEVTWPFHDLSQRETALAGLRQKLFNDGIFLSLPKGISLYLDADEAPGEDGWIMVTVRQRNGEGSGGDPDVSPALVHFYVREYDGAIEWYDVVDDRRRSWDEFLKDREAN